MILVWRALSGVSGQTAMPPGQVSLPGQIGVWHPRRHHLSQRFSAGPDPCSGSLSVQANMRTNHDLNVMLPGVAIHAVHAASKLNRSHL